MNPQQAWQETVAGAAFSEMLPVLTGRRRLREIDRVIDDLHARASLIQTGFLQRLEQSGQPGPDCVAGCDHCCYVRVHTTVVEVVRIANDLMKSKTATELEEISEQVDRFCKSLDSLGPVEYFSLRKACPLLSHRRCSVYSVRPIPCQTYLSWSVKACYDHFVLNLPSEIPKLEAMAQTMGPLAVGLSRAVVAAEAGPAWVSLPHAVRVALVPGALKEWQLGVNVFGTCEALPAPNHPEDT